MEMPSSQVSANPGRSGTSQASGEQPAVLLFDILRRSAARVAPYWNVMIQIQLRVIAPFLICASAAFAQVTLNPVPTRAVGHARQLPGFGFDTGSPNLIEGREMFYPSGIALDTTASPPILYVSDTQNNRILAWQNALTFSNGKPADRVFGQLNAYSTT